MGTSTGLQCCPKLLEGIDELERQRGLDVKPEAVPTLLRQCGDFKALAEGKRVHAYLVRARYHRDRYFGNLLVEMYGKCGSVEDARAVFESMQARNVYSWTMMIAAYAQNGCYREAVRMMHRMDLEGAKADKITFVAVLDACSSLGDLSTGRRLHDRVLGFLDSDVVLCTAVLNMYGKCGSVDDAKSVFERMTNRDVVAWNAMVAAYAQNGHCRKAFKLFARMAAEKVAPNKSTYVSLLDACSSMAGISKGRELHGLVDRAGFLRDRVVRCAVINMYGKCGSVDEARQVFEAFPDRDVALWNSMIAAYAQNGQGEMSLQVFERMKEATNNARPNAITFVHVLCACSHARLIERGRSYFGSMETVFGIQPSSQHYRCMIDLLGRSGNLDQAWNILHSMPLEPDSLAWTTMLSACRAHSNVELGELCAERLFEMEPEYSAPYVLLSNIYAARDRWDDVARIRKLMADKGVKKPSGRSSIEVGDKVHEFVAGDRAHPRREEIYQELSRLGSQMKALGYIQDRSSALRDGEEEEKEQMLWYHSEKLAIAFGSVATPARKSLYVIKNLRVCTDCHTASKFISRITGREIVLRDPYRFHHFRDGWCSCGDYW
ncbi:pentatricopeptide repeat-containing protein At4g33990 [Selaginella moellendorffii]|nr:pentatricopeptide repeat-containing protein At4g33990 [Selaginella moellendorffii]|eukprot:XP_002969969.2 pentatricopeptide repeat-containing protein At4g33990 [Selaginella moellendorffii]